MSEQTKLSIFVRTFVVAAFAALMIIAVMVTAGGCVRPVYMDQVHAAQFNQFAAAVVDWDRRCKADPNTCAESLSSMAAEMKYWAAIVNATDPNTIE